MTPSKLNLSSLQIPPEPGNMAPLDLLESQQLVTASAQGRG